MSNVGNDTVIDAEPARPVEEPPLVDTTRAQRVEGRYRSRFAVIYIALAVVAGGAIGAAVVLISRPDAAPAQAWSAWRPTGSADASIKQIAEHVSHGYRLDSGNQMTVALASAPKVTAGGGGSETGDLPISAIVVQPDTSRGLAEEGDYEVAPASSSVQFILCGLGDNCSIPEGQPSEERHALLRRQALELSLYTLKYVDDIDSVTVFLPPRPDLQAPPTSVFLRRADLKTELSHPLTNTLGAKAPRVGNMPQAELANVNRLTTPRLYSFEYTQAPDQSVILVLNPVLGT